MHLGVLWRNIRREVVTKKYKKYAVLWAFFSLLALPLYAEDISSWDDIAAIVYDERIMLRGDDLIDARIPYRSENDLRSTLGAHVKAPDGQFIKRVDFIIDENPMPVSLQIEVLSPMVEIDFEGSFRVNRGTNTHIVVELNDGRLFVEENAIKTSGVGACSAPPGTDPEEALATLGEMALSVFEAENSDLFSQEAQYEKLRIEMSHPSHSGLQIDQVSLLHIPMRYVRFLDIVVNEEDWLKIEGSISLSENPELVIALPENAETIEVRLEDSDGAKTVSKISIGDDKWL